MPTSNTAIPLDEEETKTAPLPPERPSEPQPKTKAIAEEPVTQTGSLPREAAPSREALPSKLPDTGDNPSLDQRNAMNAQELAKQGRTDDLRQFLDRTTTAKAVDAGLKDIVQFFGLKGGAVDTGVDPRAQVRMAQAAATGEGAMTRDELQTIYQTVDPNNQLREDAKLIAGMNATYEYYMQKGQPQKAAAVQRGILLHVKNVVARGGAIAQAALEEGDIQGGAKAIAQMHSLIPDGQSMQVKGIGRDGTVHYSMIDDETGELTFEGKARVNQLMHLATGMQNGSVWFEQMSGIAQKAAQVKHSREREAVSDQRYEAGQERAARAEQRAVQGQERADARFAAQEADRKKRNEFYDRRGDAQQQWADVSTGITAAQQDMADAQASGDKDAIKQAEENLKAATQAGADFLKSSPEAARFTQQFNTMTRPRVGKKASAEGATQTGNRAGGMPSVEDRLNNPETFAAVDAEVAKILPKASDAQKAGGRRLILGVMKANDDVDAGTARLAVHHVLAGTEGVELSENAIKVPGLGQLAISKATYLDLKEMAAHAARSRQNAAANPAPAEKPNRTLMDRVDAGIKTEGKRFIEQGKGYVKSATDTADSVSKAVSPSRQSPDAAARGKAIEDSRRRYVPLGRPDPDRE